MVLRPSTVSEQLGIPAMCQIVSGFGGDPNKWLVCLCAGMSYLGLPSHYNLDKEEVALERARIYLQWARDHDGKYPRGVYNKQAKDRRRDGSVETTREQRLVEWFKRTQHSARKHYAGVTGRAGRYHASVDQVLTEALGPRWYDGRRRLISGGKDV